MNQKNTHDRIILGIDPGTNVMGFGVIGITKSKISVIQYGNINLSKLEDHYVKLRNIYEKIEELIDDFLPDEMAIEAPFYGKNVQSMLKLGRAQGVCMAAAISKKIPVFEYAPKKVKTSITGNGNASKEQVALTIQRSISKSINIDNLDSTDALAIALCHHYQNKLPTKKGKSSGWDSFLKNNPNRIKFK